MSQTSSTDESCIRSGRRSLPRSWGGTPVEAPENPAHYLHLRAFPCKKCKGPVVAGWIGKREDAITRETNVAVLGGVCLLCGARVDTLNATSAPSYFRPVEWEWPADNKPVPTDSDEDPLSLELSQDADRPRLVRSFEEPQP